MRELCTVLGCSRAFWARPRTGWAAAVIKMWTAPEPEQMFAPRQCAPNHMRSFEPMMRVAATTASGVVFADLVAQQKEWRRQARGKLGLLQ